MALETYIVLETRSDKLLARSVDRVDPIWIETPGRQKYIENEILIVDQTNTSSLRDQGTVLQLAILSSHFDASFLGLEPLGIQNYPDGDSKFEERLTNEQEEEFDEALELKDAGEHARAGKILRRFLSRFPFHIDTYQHLGVIEYRNNRRGRAFKYFEMGYRIGMESVLQSQPKRLPWGMTDNRPFLRAAHSYALGLSERKRYIEAIEIYERILEWNPDDNQGIRFILPSEYVEAQLPSKAKEYMDAHGADGMNVFTRCLVEVLEGHFDEAIRWLCQGLCNNVHFPSIATGRDKQPLQKESYGLVLGSREEASDYLKYNPTWNQPLAQSFLRKVLDAGPLANRIRQVIQLQSEIASRNGSDQSAERVRLIEESFRVFDQQSIRKILRELQALGVF